MVALAEASYGSEDVFVDHMNKRALELGLTNTNFKNPHGLDAADHYSSARDMSVIARELSKHEKVFEFTSLYDDYLRENTDRKIWLVNTNKLVKFYDGVDGLKTGFTNGAGYCITATAKRNNLRIIAVVMGEPTSKMRNKEISEMLDYSFAHYSSEKLFKSNVLGKYKVDGGKKEYIDVSFQEVPTVFKKKGDQKNITYDVKLDNLKAPINKGDVVGKIVIKDDGSPIRTINLISLDKVLKVNFSSLLIRNIRDVIIGKVII